MKANADRDADYRHANSSEGDDEKGLSEDDGDRSWTADGSDEIVSSSEEYDSETESMASSNK